MNSIILALLIIIGLVLFFQTKIAMKLLIKFGNYLLNRGYTLSADEYKNIRRKIEKKLRYKD